MAGLRAFSSPGELMEKGSFHTSVKSVLEMDEIADMMPLPNERPSTPDLSKFPPEALRSSAVETLLGQNSDLMARLSVSLRKNGQLETKINELENENAHLRHRYGAVKDQVLVVQEKERLLSERSAKIGAETETLRDRLTALERRYADVYTHSQGLERQLRRLRNYRFRMQAVTGNLRQKAGQLFAMINPEPGQNKSVTSALALAERELKSASDGQSGLVERYETEIAMLRSENSAAHKQLVSQYEGDISSLRSEMELLRRRAADRDLLYEAKIRIENQLVFEERQSRLYRDETQKELQSTREENLDLREQLKTRLIEMERLQRELAIASDRAQLLDAQEKEKIDQVESLQLLWKEKQSQVEHVEEKMRALQKLNQQLSVSLNSQRKEIIDLKAELEKQNYAAQEKIKAFELQLKK